MDAGGCDGADGKVSGKEAEQKGFPLDLQAHVMSIIAQEAESFLNGSKSLEEVTKVMQSRVSVMVQENR